MKKNLMRSVCGFAAAAFLFGYIYPEFLVNSDSVRAYYYDERGIKVYVECEDSRDLYEELLQADAKNITIKSRLLDYVRQLWKKD